MGQKQRIMLCAVAGVTVVLAIFFLIFHDEEPRYRGQSLTYWTAKLRAGNRREQVEAREALRRMGASAVPLLIHQLENRDFPLKYQIWSYWRRVPFLSRFWRPASVIFSQANAAAALGEIGPPASNAIPILTRARQTKNVSAFPMSAASLTTMPGPGQTTANVPISIPKSVLTAALMKIKGEPVGPLIQLLDDTRSTRWSETASIVAEFGSEARPAIPALCRALKSGDSRVRMKAAVELGRIHCELDISVPALLDSVYLPQAGGDEGFPFHLHDNPAFAPAVFDRPMIKPVVDALGEFEDGAGKAIPFLQQHLQDPEPLTRASVLTSLSRILPAQETKTLVPLLVLNLNDPDPYLRATSTNLLVKIDPEAAAKAGVR